MKRKNTAAGKSKEADKVKSEEPKSHRHSRRRKSESSDSDDSCRKSTEQLDIGKRHRDSPKAGVESPRATRSSKRLSASNDDAKEDKPISLTLKIRRDNSPLDAKTGENSKAKNKEVNVWKVKSSNGRSSDKLQVLKICRQRTPEPNELQQISDENSKNEVESIRLDAVVSDSGVHEQEVDDGDANSSTSSCSGNTTKYLTADNMTEESLCEISLQRENSADISIPPESASEKNLPIPTDNEESSVANCNNVEESVYVRGDLDEASQQNAELTNVCVDDTDEVKSKDSNEENIPNETSDLKVEESNKSIDSDSDSESGENTRKAIDGDMETNFAVQSPDGDKDPIIEISIENTISAEDIVVDTMEVVEESLGKVNSESAENVEKSQKEENNDKKRPQLKSQKSIDDMQDEEYDYEENDIEQTNETKEEGELSGNETLSPACAMYNKLNKEDRVRNWGMCCTFTFNKSVLEATESILQDHDIQKANTTKDIMLIDSDTDDLIFVKEIRKDSIIHVVDTENKHNSSLDTKSAEEIDSDNNQNDENKASHTDENVSVMITFQTEGGKHGENHRKSNDKDSSHNRRSKGILERRQRSPQDRSERAKKHSSSKSNSIKQTPTDVLFITNLVRPFTISQLKELLQKYGGNIVEDGFWLDTIKSKCYVQYEDVEQAQETRLALHGINWPVNNPKTLHVEYATPNDLFRAQTQLEVSDIPRKTEPLRMDNSSNRRAERNEYKRKDNVDDKPRVHNIGVREWDIGKPKNPDEMTYFEEETRKSGRRESRRSRSPIEGASAAKKPKKEERETKVLDDLFRRTKATPSIYWLPLTTEQIAEKEEGRRKQIEVIKNHIPKPRESDSHRRRDNGSRRSRRSPHKK